jgi:hypothetical protein
MLQNVYMCELNWRIDDMNNVIKNVLRYIWYVRQVVKFVWKSLLRNKYIGSLPTVPTLAVIALPHSPCPFAASLDSWHASSQILQGEVQLASPVFLVWQAPAQAPAISLELGWFCTVAIYKASSWFFKKIIFISATRHFFTKLWR